MKRDDLDRAYGPTPQNFTDQIDTTLRSLKEDEPVNAKRFTLRTALIAALILLLLCGIAYAIVAMQGQEWYYDNRFTTLQEYQPEKHQAIMDNLQTEVPQEESYDEQGLVSVTVQDYAWSAGQNLFTLSVAARPVKEDLYELYSFYALDTDGANVGVIDPDDPESRLEHWLWTDNWFGPPQEVMKDPSKQLLLIDFSQWKATIPGTDIGILVYSMDDFIGEDGASVWVLEFNMSSITQGTGSEKTVVDEYIDADGYLTLQMGYWVYTFQDGEIDYSEHTDGTVTFQVKVK